MTVLTYFTTTRHNPGDSTTHRKKKQIKRRKNKISNIPSAFLKTQVRIYHSNRCSEPQKHDTAAYSKVQQFCLDGKSELLHGAGRLCLTPLTAQLVFHKQLYFICYFIMPEASWHWLSTRVGLLLLPTH